MIFSLFLGCTKSQPDDLPTLRPCTIRIVNDSKPVAGIHVGLICSDGQGPWSMGGVTDDASTIFGSFEGKGIPEGSYTVLFAEKIDYPPQLNLSVDEMLRLPQPEKDDYHEKRNRFIQESRKVPAVLTDSEKTPLQITVAETGGSLEIDISQYQ